MEAQTGLGIPWSWNSGRLTWLLGIFGFSGSSVPVNHGAIPPTTEVHFLIIKCSLRIFKKDLCLSYVHLCMQDGIPDTLGQSRPSDCHHPSPVPLRCCIFLNPMFPGWKPAHPSNAFASVTPTWVTGTYCRFGFVTWC